MNQAEPREEAVFEAALQLPTDQRAAFLDQTCAEDADLRRRVEALLGAFERAGGFMKAPAISLSPIGGEGQGEGAARHSLPTEKPGDRIGRYKLLEQIGEGGCGVVYVAEQEEPVRRRVALKVIKLGMDTRQVIARFDAERQALAMMDHPNIAKIFDAGVTGIANDELRITNEFDIRHSTFVIRTGRPYFVMELVRGIRITDYCDQNQLAPRERLDLFTQVCRAIQHAHQKGVIHRDIKPSNILVTLHDGVPVPMVIDFGIAKATQGRLTDQTVYTAFEQFIGTPAYMSPEQAEMSGLDIDTRSDIYSLGVLLYELLTGKTPFDAKELLAAGLDELRRTIREVEPIKPSTRLTQELVAADVRRLTSKSEVQEPKSYVKIRASSRRLLQEVRGDLDWIVMKCLEKDRTRRYETANGLATDIARHLSDEPIVARPPSKVYQFQKSVQRNKLAFGAAAAVGLALVIGFAVSTAMYFNAQSEKKKAQTEAAKSQQVAQFLKDMLNGVGPSVALGRDTTMLREILDKTVERVGKDLTNQPEVEVELCLTLAATYHDLGLYRQMEGVARQSLQIARLRLGEENESVSASLTALGDALQHLGEVHAANLEEAEKYSRAGLAMTRKLLGNENLKVANALHHLANVLATQSKLAEAETMQREALAMYERLIGHERPEVAKALFDLAMILREGNRLAEAENINREALALQRKLLGDDHPEVAKSLRSLAAVLWYQGKLAEAEAKYREALAMWRKLQANDRVEVDWTVRELGMVLQEQGKLAEAETIYREALAIQRKLFADSHPRTVQLVNDLKAVLEREGKQAQAKARLEGQTNAVTEKKSEPR